MIDNKAKLQVLINTKIKFKYLLSDILLLIKIKTKPILKIINIYIVSNKHVRDYIIFFYY